MYDSKKRISQIKNIVTGLSNNDPREVEIACKFIKEELIPALELSISESKKSALETLNLLISEKRPPKDIFELLDLEIAVIYKNTNDEQIEVINKEKTKPRKEFLKSKNTSLQKLEKQFKGRQFGELVLYHIKVHTPKQINDTIKILIANLYPALAIETLKFIETVVYRFSKTKKIWKHDCGDTLRIYTTATKVEAEKCNIKVSDDYAYDVFELIVFSLAQRAINEPEFKNFIKRSVRKFWIF